MKCGSPKAPCSAKTSFGATCYVFIWITNYDVVYHPREAAQSGGERVRVDEGWRKRNTLFLHRTYIYDIHFKQERNKPVVTEGEGGKQERQRKNSEKLTRIMEETKKEEETGRT